MYGFRNVTNAPVGTLDTPRLARMLDSLVRVSRRVGKRPEEFVADRHRRRSYETTTSDTATYCPPSARRTRLRRVARRDATRNELERDSFEQGPTANRSRRLLAATEISNDGHAERARHPEFRRPDSRALSVYPRTVSRTIELSLQSSFQLSLTVLVRYRSRGRI